MSTNQTKQRLSRRQMLRIMAGGAAATGLSALVAACGGAAGTQPGGTQATAGTQPGGTQATAQAPAQSSGTTTLQFITPGALGKERDLYQSFINGFQQENPNIKVNVSFEAWNDYMTKLPTILASGTVPDVIHQHMSIVQDYGARGALLDLAPLMQRDSVSPEEYIPALFEAFSNEGKTYAIPKDSAAWGIYYNKAMFDAAGVPYPKDDWTLDDFRNYAVELTRDQNNNPASSPSFDPNNIKQWGFVWLEPTPTTSEITRGFVKAYGGDWYNEGYTETLINDPKVQSYFQLMVDLRCKLHATPTAAQAAGQGDPFRTGLVAMAQSFHVMDFFSREEKVAFPYDVTYIPSGPGGQYVPVGASGWAIPAKAPNPDASWQLVRYLTSQKVQEAIGKEKRWGVSQKESIDAIVPDSPISGFKKVHTDPLQGNSDRTVISFKFPAKQSQIREAYTSEFDAVWNCNSDDVAGAATRVKEQVDPLLQG
jgi:multiple sugar transport system substrate-binding protein